MAVARIERVMALTAKQLVVASTTGERIVAFAAVQFDGDRDS